MVDWPGLLQWSLAYTDATPASSFKPMDSSTRQWLREALESFAFQESEKLRKISMILSTPETGEGEEERKVKEEILEELMAIIDNPELAQNFINCGGIKHLVSCMLGSRYMKVRKMSAQIFSAAAQNNPAVQTYALSEGVLAGLFQALGLETDISAKECYLSSLSALVRGEFAEGRQAFMVENGLNLIRDIMQQQASLRMTKRALLLLGNLFYYDKADPSLEIYERALGLEFVSVLLSMEQHEDLEVRQMALQALHNLRRREGPGSQQITEGIEAWRRRLRQRADREEELSALEDMLRATAS